MWGNIFTGKLKFDIFSDRAKKRVSRKIEAARCVSDHQKDKYKRQGVIN